MYRTHTSQNAARGTGRIQPVGFFPVILSEKKRKRKTSHQERLRPHRLDVPRGRPLTRP